MPEGELWESRRGALGRKRGCAPIDALVTGPLAIAGGDEKSVLATMAAATGAAELAVAAGATVRTGAALPSAVAVLLLV